MKIRTGFVSNSSSSSFFVSGFGIEFDSINEFNAKFSNNIFKNISYDEYYENEEHWINKQLKDSLLKCYIGDVFFLVADYNTMLGTETKNEFELRVKKEIEKCMENPNEYDLKYICKSYEVFS